MRDVTPAQDALYARDTVQPIKLVTLTTYTDRDAGTVQERYYLSDRPVLYGSQQFEKMLNRIDSITRGMNHVPSSGGDYASSLGAELRLWLMNEAYRGGDRFYAILRALNLERCDLEIATVLSGGSWYDLRSLAGTEHIVHGRGTLRRVEGVSTDAMQLRFETPLPALPWIYALDATITDPKDLGSRLPIVYGAARKVKCINYEVGWTTTLTVALVATDTAGVGLYVTDPTGFPITAFMVQIDGERITIDARSASTELLIVSTRAEGGTLASLHIVGATVLELPDQIVIAVAGHETSAVDTLYVKNPYSQSLFSVQTYPTPDLADTVTVAGETISSITFTQAELIDLLDACQVSAQVSTQPEFGGTTSYATANPSSYALSYAYGSTYIQNFHTFSGSASSPKWTWGTPTDYSIYHLTVGTFPNKTVGGVKLTATLNYSLAGGYYGSTASVNLVANGIGGLSTHTVTAVGGSSGTVNYDMDWVSWSGNPSTQNGTGYFKAYPSVVGTPGSTTGDSLELSNITIHYWYVDSGATTRTVDVAIEAASVGYGLDFCSDVSGPVVPAVYALGYDFGAATGWSAAGCTVSADAGALKLTVAETLLQDCDTDAASWTAYRCTIENDATDKTQGTGSMKITQTTAYNNSASVHTFSPTTGEDWSGMLIAFDAKLTLPARWISSGVLTATLGVYIFISDATSGTTGTEWSFGTNDGLGSGEWVTIIFDPATRAPYASWPPLDLTQVRHVNFLSGVTDGTLHEYRVDNLRLISKTTVAQRNATTGVVDLSADGPEYRLSTMADASAAFEAVDVYFENTAGSGTTKPTSNVRTLTAATLGDGSFAAVVPSLVDTGTPAVSDVETIGIVATLRSTPPGVLLGPPVLRVDALECRIDALNPYSAAVGALIEHPADVLRHLIVERCGEPASTIDDTIFGAYATALGAAAKVGADLRIFGDAFGQVATLIAYEGRANLVRDEGASAATWRPLSAGVSPDYEFGSEVRTLTEWTRFSESGRDVGELAARTLIYYGYDPSLGTSEAAYSAVLQATPEVCDVPGTTTTELAALEAKFGRREAQRIFLRTIADADTAKDVAGYYVREARRLAALWIIEGCAWWEAYDLERGDIVTVTPPWETSARKARVIEIVKSFKTETVDLRVVEVP